VATVISGLFASATVLLDRRARRRELIFTKALELAKLKVDTLIDLYKTTGKRIFTADPVEYAEWYYKILEQLHSTGRLPTSWEDDYEKRFSGR
jgi:hypothetical protein